MDYFKLAAELARADANLSGIERHWLELDGESRRALQLYNALLTPVDRTLLWVYGINLKPWNGGSL